MKFREQLEDAITEEAKKLSLRYHAYHNALHLEHERRKKRTTAVQAKVLKVPDYWLIDRKFDPFYVHRNRSSIARSIAEKITRLDYSPRGPHKRLIKKPKGGTREICVYQIPDAAVSSLFYRTLLKKNQHRFSGSSYAYRADRNAHFAIQDIEVRIREYSRIFVAEYDFSKFFDSIDHDHLFSQFNANGFSISPRDEHVIKAFLKPGTRGIPQGTSLSLFLANLVCWKLDRRLEDRGLKFARYADDTLIWSPEFSKISDAAHILHDFSAETGVKINYKVVEGVYTKSKGIRLLCSDEMPSEFAGRTNSVDFLGYQISIDNISIKHDSVVKIKRQINFILYDHLLRPLRGSKLSAIQIPSNGRDPDLVSALSSIRRYLYGNLSDEFIRRFLAGSTGHIFYKGVMSFYPLLTDKQQMCDLDGWLVNQVWKAVRMRLRLLVKWKFNRAGDFPFNVPRAKFVADLRTYKKHGRGRYSIPSFVVIYLALRKIVSEQGVQQLLGKDGY